MCGAARHDPGRRHFRRRSGGSQCRRRFGRFHQARRSGSGSTRTASAPRLGPMIVDGRRGLEHRRGAGHARLERGGQGKGRPLRMRLGDLEAPRVAWRYGPRRGVGASHRAADGAHWPPKNAAWSRAPFALPRYRRRAPGSVSSKITPSSAGASTSGEAFAADLDLVSTGREGPRQVSEKQGVVILRAVWVEAITCAKRLNEGVAWGLTRFDLGSSRHGATGPRRLGARGVDGTSSSPAARSAASTGTRLPSGR